MDGRVDKALTKRRSTGDDLQGRKKAVKVAAVAHHAVANPADKQADREQSYITDGKAVRVRVWGKADEYPYKCTTLSLSVQSDSNSHKRLQVC